MKQIYCLTEFNEKMEQQGCEMFMTLKGVAKWLTEQKIIDNKMSVTDSELAGDYDITADNLGTLVTECKKQNMAASFTISRDFFIQVIETRYTLSTVNVND